MLRPEAHDCCPPSEHPNRPRIRAGLPAIPRQITGFPQYRRAMLHALEGKVQLADWQADSSHDLGVMLIEAWAYVLDITGFYDALIANRSYLGTASDDVIAAQIVSLTGYRPRPAMVASVRLALEARGRDAVVAPAGTSFRSQPFGAEKAQTFEVAAPTTVWPQRNRWQLLPVHGNAFDGVLRFAPNEGPEAKAVITVELGNQLHAARVAASEVLVEPDGIRYRVVTLDPPLPASFSGITTATIDVRTLLLAASPSPLDGSSAMTTTSAILDTLYPLVQASTPAAIEINGVLHVRVISSVGIHNHEQMIDDTGSKAYIPLTTITYDALSALPANAGIKIYLVPRAAGKVMNLALAEIDADDVRGDGRLADRTMRLGSAPAAGQAMAIGQRARGLDLPGLFVEGSLPRYVPDPGGTDESLEAPVSVLGNIVTALRGETVDREILGSGNAQMPSQRFVLKKKPLAWIDNPATTWNRSPQITLWVDGIEWRWVEGFYGQDYDARIYMVEMAPDGTATIVGGDGVRGARFPSGNANLVASYRHGAGAAKPPPGSISQFTNAAPGLARVSQPLDAWGGADAENASEMRALAPAGALTLGRAISLADFEAMIRGQTGVINAAVSYSWDGSAQEAVVCGWIIADAGDPSPTLAASLAAKALPGLVIRIALATRIDLPVFDVAITAAPDHSPDAVKAAVRMALFDMKTGYLAPRNVPVSAPLFRSQLLAAIHAVPGVKSVDAVTLVGGAMPKALVPGDGAWFDFLQHGQIL